MNDALSVQNAYKEVFNSPLGKVILEHLFVNLKMGETTIVPNDPLSTAYNEGRRTVYMEILKHCELDLTPFLRNAINGRM